MILLNVGVGDRNKHNAMTFPIIPTLFRIYCSDTIVLIVTYDNDDGGQEEGGENEDESNQVI